MSKTLEHYHNLVEQDRSQGRLKIIFNGLKNGLDNAVIDRQLAAYDYRLETGQKRGQKSVNRVIKAIKEEKIIGEIRQIKDFSGEDIYQKRDLAVVINNYHGFYDQIWIQVKSSCREVENFYTLIDKNGHQAQQILTERKLIVLNGNISPSRIRSEFYRQLDLLIK